MLGQWEELDAGTDTARHNLAKLGIPHVLAPPDEWPYDAMPDDLDLVYANPPCAIWSISGKNLGHDDPRLEYTDRAMATALRLRPNFFALESVTRAWTKGREVYERWGERFRRAGYGTTVLLTNAVLHGAPQYRERFHFIAHRYALNLPAPAVLLPDEVATVRDAIGDLPAPVAPGETPALPNHVLERGWGPRFDAILPYMLPGERWQAAWERARDDGVDGIKARNITRRLVWDAPATTLLDTHAWVHPDEHRTITVREAARLCGYPDWFEFKPRPNRLEEISQAVLPAIGDYLGQTFVRALDAGRELGRAERSTMRLIDLRPLSRPLQPHLFVRALREANQL